MKKLIIALALAVVATDASALLNTTRMRDIQTPSGWYNLLSVNRQQTMPHVTIPDYGSPYGVFKYRSYPFHFVNATFDNGTTVYSKLMCGSGVLVGWEQMGANPAYCFGVTQDKKVELIELLTGEELKASEDWPMVSLRGRHYENITLQDLKFKDICAPYSGLKPDDCFYPQRDFPKKAVSY